MTSYNTQNKIVLDEILEKMESINTDIVPGSRKEYCLSCTENVASLINSNASPFATYELSPQNGYINNVDKTYIHNVMTFNFKYQVSETNLAGMLAVGVDKNSDFAESLYILLNSEPLLSTTLNRMESAIGNASLPNHLAESMLDTTTLEQVLRFESPTYRYFPITTSMNTDQDIKYTYDYIMNLNTMSTALSSIKYIIASMGRLRLKIYYTDIWKAFKYVYIPPMIATDATEAMSSIVELRPIHWGAADPLISACTTTGAHKADATITFNFNRKDFMSCSLSEIRQENFDILPESAEQLQAYVASQGAWIIPVETMISQPIEQTTATQRTTSITAQITTNNINDVIITYQPEYAPTTFINPAFKNLQLLIDGMPVNQQSYNYMDARAINDFTNAVLNTDNSDINTNFKWSLILPSERFINDVDRLTYNTSYPFAKALNGANIRFMNSLLLKPNTCMLPFDTAIEGGFHTGVCTLETKVGSVQFRINTSYEDLTTYADYKNMLLLPKDNSGTVYNVYITTIVDGCIVLKYNAQTGEVVSGGFSYAKPYAT